MSKPTERETSKYSSEGRLEFELLIVLLFLWAIGIPLATYWIFYNDKVATEKPLPNVQFTTTPQATLALRPTVYRLTPTRLVYTQTPTKTLTPTKTTTPTHTLTPTPTLTLTISPCGVIQ